ncbi:MAG: hypothetical protein LBQ60_14910 [Bacteroidales bacterium]|nr:hypothetical protein [Bacteroidales bacterium]
MAITKNRIEGFHYYPEASGNVSFLRYSHRHIFHVECGFGVTGANREIEIFTRQFQIAEYFAHIYGVPAQFGGMSCEMIAQSLFKAFKECSYVKITEDGEGGAIVQG